MSLPPTALPAAERRTLKQETLEDSSSSCSPKREKREHSTSAEHVGLPIKGGVGKRQVKGKSSSETPDEGRAELRPRGATRVKLTLSTDRNDDLMH